MGVQALNKPTIELMKAFRDTLRLRITDARLEDVLRGLSVNWEFYQAIGNISLDKEDDPAKYLATLVLAGRKSEQE